MAWAQDGSSEAVLIESSDALRLMGYGFQPPPSYFLRSRQARNDEIHIIFSPDK